MRTEIYAGGNVSRANACARSVLRASSVSLFFAFRGCASDAKEASLTSKVDSAFFISLQQGELPGSGVLGCILCLCEETLPLFQAARVCCCSSSSCRSWSMLSGSYAGDGVSRANACARGVHRDSRMSLLSSIRGCASDALQLLLFLMQFVFQQG